MQQDLDQNEHMFPAYDCIVIFVPLILKDIEIDSVLAEFLLSYAEGFRCIGNKFQGK